MSSPSKAHAVQSKATMTTIDRLRHEIGQMRLQLGRHRRETSRLRCAGLDVAATEALIGRIQTRIRELCAQRDELRKVEPSPTKGKVGPRKW